MPHTVYVKTLYCIAGQDYWRHHIIRAAAAADVITEVKPARDWWRWRIEEQPRPSLTSPTGADLMYAITLHQP